MKAVKIVKNEIIKKRNRSVEIKIANSLTHSDQSFSFEPGKYIPGFLFIKNKDGSILKHSKPTNNYNFYFVQDI